MNPTLIITAAALAAASSLHCVGMCGPLAVVLPLPAQLTGWPRWWRLLVYHGWRIMAYLIIGLVFTLSQVAILKVGSVWQLQRGLAWLMASMALALLLLPVVRSFAEGHFSRWLSPMTRGLMKHYQNLKNQNPLLAFSLLGFMHGLLPCGMVYGAAAIFAATQDVGGSLAGMVIFGGFTSGILVAFLTFWRELVLRFRIKPISGGGLRLVQVTFILLAALMVWRSQALLSLPTTADGDKPVAIECHN